LTILLTTALSVQACSDDNVAMSEEREGEATTEYPKLINSTEAYPSSYAQASSRPGTVVRLSYATHDYVSGNLEARQNNVSVYLPYSYSDSQRYNVLYLVHGHYGDDRTFLSVNDSLLKHVLDNMIAQGDIDPLIVVTPTYNYGSPTSDYVAADPYCEALPQELLNDLIPLVESRYSSYAESTDEQGLADSRDHRAIGGFSMGGVTTWYAFDETLSLFRYYLPMSGDCWSLGTFVGMSRPTETAEYLARRITEQGYTANDFYIWAASGTGDSAYREILNQIEGMNDYGEPFSLSNLTFHQKQGARHEYTPMVEYIYNALPFIFPHQTTSQVCEVTRSTVNKAGKAYNLQGQHVAKPYHGLIIEDGHKTLYK
jgi:enterochelin esterase-like enzyme